MKLGLAVSFCLFFSSIALAAQNAAPRPKVFRLTPSNAAPLGITLLPSSAVAGCPVSLRAQHLADGSLVRAGSRHPAGVGQWLHLTLDDRGSSEIAKATVTIHGMSDKGRTTQTAINDGSSDALRTMTVQFSTHAPGPVASDVWVPGMTAVQRIDLDSVVYADGMVSSFAGQQACRVTPDPFMLIAGR